MRILVPGVVLAAAFLGGCRTCPAPEIIGPSWDTPEKAFATFRAAVLAKRPDVIYESFSPGFRKHYDVPGYREFKAGYEAREDEFDRIARVFRHAKLTGVERSVHEGSGLRFARVLVSAGDLQGSFVLVEIPTAHLLVEIEGYDPEPADFFVPGPGFGGHLRVDDGIVRIALDATEAGVMSPEELREIRFHHQWLLEDIQDLPVDVRGIIDSLRAPAGDPE
jgi:hypothetical protein